jgi:diadenosine tetraphosphatase ApaH/serine/threonine PP2A family protein phosphatase
VLYAVIGDVHSNLGALEAVLADARARGATKLLDLGDSVYGPLDPGGTARLLMSPGMPSVHVRGNQDRNVVDPHADLALNRSLLFTRQRLGPEAMAWLAALPLTVLVENELRLCHGTPSSDEVYLLEAPGPHGSMLRSRADIAHLLRGAQDPVVLCAHTHLQRVVQLPGGPLVVNPGSVGSPAFADVEPLPYRVESGSPHARYAILENGPHGWSADLVSVPYDHEAAAALATLNGREDWAVALRTGWAS